MQLMPEPGTYMSKQLLQASKLDNRSKLLDIIELLSNDIRPMPRRIGVGDAMVAISKAYYLTNDAHGGEIYSILALRYAPSMMDSGGYFDSWVNLVNYSMVLKSFHEAWDYGLHAEKIRPDDSDLLGNMAIIAANLGFCDESLKRFEKLQQINPMKAAFVKQRITGEGPEFIGSTRHLDCKDIAKSLHKGVTSILKRMNKRKPPKKSSSIIKSIAKLQERPEGVKSRQCWLELCRLYGSMVEIAVNEDNEYLFAFAQAGLVASIGKVVNSDSKAAASDALLWRIRGEAYRQLRLFEFAVSAFERAEAIAPDLSTGQNLAECRSMVYLRESARNDPTLYSTTARSAANTPGKFWEGFDLFQEQLFVMRIDIRERCRRAKDLHQLGYSAYGKDFHKAICFLCEAAALNPENPHVWQELASVHSHLGRYQEAELFQRYAVKLAVSEPTYASELERFASNWSISKRNRARSDSNVSIENRAEKMLQSKQIDRFIAGDGDGEINSKIRK